MDTTLFPIIYMVVSVGICLLLKILNQRTGMAARHRQHDMVAYLGVAGKHGAGGIAVDSKAAFGWVILCAIMIGGPVGWGIPHIWIVTEATMLDRAAQIVGAIAWAISAIQLITWFFTAMIVAVVLGVVAAVIFFPIQYLVQGKVGVDVKFNGFGIEEKVMAWREELKEKKQPPKQEEQNRTKMENLRPFVGMWKFEGTAPPYGAPKFIEITTTGQINYFLGSRWIKHTAPLYGNKDMIVTEELKGKDRFSFLFQSVSPDRLDYIRDRYLKEREPLQRADRDQVMKEASEISATARVQAEANRIKWEKWQAKQDAWEAQNGRK